jgi:hypothetical protein
MPGKKNRRTIDRRSGAERRHADRRSMTAHRIGVTRAGPADNRRSALRRLDYRRSVVNRRAVRSGPEGIS